jgi:hypothetical protein
MVVDEDARARRARGHRAPSVRPGLPGDYAPLLYTAASKLAVGSRAFFGSPLESSIEFFEALMRVLEQGGTEAD